MHDWMSKLERAKKLLDAGALTPEEFEAEKTRLLPRSSPANQQNHAVNILGRGNEVDEAEDWDSEPVPVNSSTKIGLALVLAMAIAATVFVLLKSEPSMPSASISPAHPTNSMVTPTIAEKTASKPIVQAAPDNDGKFKCVGAYSDVSFSEESGDGSGLFVRISDAGEVTWLYYEGGASVGEVTTSNRSADEMSATVRYPSYPSQAPSSVEFHCNDGKLTVQGEHIRQSVLRKLTEKEAGELEQ